MVTCFLLCEVWEKSDGKSGEKRRKRELCPSLEPNHGSDRCKRSHRPRNSRYILTCSGITMYSLFILLTLQQPPFLIRTFIKPHAHHRIISFEGQLPIADELQVYTWYLPSFSHLPLSHNPHVPHFCKY